MMSKSADAPWVVRRQTRQSDGTTLLVGSIRVKSTTIDRVFASEEAERLIAVADQQVFRLLIVLKHHLVIFATDTRLLVATECSVCGVKVIAVGPHASGLNRSAETICPCAIASPHTRTKPIQRVICNRQRLFL